MQIQVQKQTQIQVQYQIGIRSAAGPRWLEADCKHCTSVSLANYHSQYFVPCTFKKLQLSRNTVHLETAPINSLCIFFLKICTSPNLIHSVHRLNNNSASQSLVSRIAQTYSYTYSYSNTWMHKRTKTQTHRYTNAQMRKHTSTSAECRHPSFSWPSGIGSFGTLHTSSLSRCTLSMPALLPRGKWGGDLPWKRELCKKLEKPISGVHCVVARCDLNLLIDWG